MTAHPTRPIVWSLVYVDARTLNRYEATSTVKAQTSAVETSARALRLRLGLPKFCLRLVSCQPYAPPVQGRTMTWRDLKADTPPGAYDLRTGSNGKTQITERT
jgi:hypothetical protein